MAHGMHIQYLGYQAESWGRVYSYRAIGGTSEKREQRDFTFAISNQAFSGHRLPYQAAADLCYQKLQKALDLETAEVPFPLHSTLSDHEVEEYCEKHLPVQKRNW
jgi:hypothetical protein